MARNTETTDASVQTTFKFNRQTLETIDQLKKEYGASTKAEVIRKAIALLEIAREARASGGNMVVQNGDGSQNKILGV